MLANPNRIGKMDVAPNLSGLPTIWLMIGVST